MELVLVLVNLILFRGSLLVNTNFLILYFGLNSGLKYNKNNINRVYSLKSM